MTIRATRQGSTCDRLRALPTTLASEAAQTMSLDVSSPSRLCGPELWSGRVGACGFAVLGAGLACVTDQHAQSDPHLADAGPMHSALAGGAPVWPRVPGSGPARASRVEGRRSAARNTVPRYVVDAHGGLSRGRSPVCELGGTPPGVVVCGVDSCSWWKSDPQSHSRRSGGAASARLAVGRGLRVRTGPDGAALLHSWRAMLKPKVAPCPGCEVAHARPPCRATIRLTSDRPTPVPG